MISKSANRKTQPQKEMLEFELNPLISEIVLWNDADLVQGQLEFVELPKAFRIARICESLFSHGVAFVDFQPTAVWLPVSGIEQQCGGSRIVALSKYTLNLNFSSGGMQKAFEKAIKAQFREKLQFTVIKSVAAFRAFNNGFTSIDGVDRVGMLRWRPMASGNAVQT